MFMVLLTLVCAFFIFTDLGPAWRKKQWPRFWIYLGILLLAYVLNVLPDADVKIPSPSEPLKKIVTAIWGITS